MLVKGGQACALPFSEHKGYGGVHNYEKEAGVTGNDSLTSRAQAMEEGTREKKFKNEKPKKCKI